MAAVCFVTVLSKAFEGAGPEVGRALRKALAE
jgi:hypothetical protein